MTKTCSKCSTDKPLSEFYHAHGRPRAHCKECNKPYRKAQYIRDGGKDHSYAESLRRNYGITMDDYTAMHTAQGGACKVCRQIAGHRLQVDHNHATGAVRGLLCARCNRLIAALESVDDRAVVHAAYAYLASA